MAAEREAAERDPWSARQPSTCQPNKTTSKPTAQTHKQTGSLQVQELLNQVAVHKLAGGGGGDDLVAEGPPLQARGRGVGMRVGVGGWGR